MTELDYEATKAALRAQLTVSPTANRRPTARVRKWFGGVTAAIVVVCASIVTVVATTASPSASVQMVPSGDHRGATPAAVDYRSPRSETAPTPKPTPRVGDLTAPPGSVTADAPRSVPTSTPGGPSPRAIVRDTGSTATSSPSATQHAPTPRIGSGSSHSTPPPGSGGSTQTPSPTTGGSTPPTSPTEPSQSPGSGTDGPGTGGGTSPGGSDGSGDSSG